MLEKLILKFGAKPNRPPAEISLTPLTIFVGPNNSGKSKALGEIKFYCEHGTNDSKGVILEKIGMIGLSLEDANEKIAQMMGNIHQGGQLGPDSIRISTKSGGGIVSRRELTNSFTNPNSDAKYFCKYLLAHRVLNLSGQNRALVGGHPTGDLKLPPDNSYRILFDDSIKRKKVRSIIHSAFDGYFVIDSTYGGHLSLSLSPREPRSEIEEKGFHPQAVEFHRNAQPIAEMSDGVQAFTNIILEIIAGDPSVLLIDEPEAFLHPTLSFKLGKEVANLSKGSDKHIFVSTHSSNFVMGCIQSGEPVNIVRLTYRENVATARQLPDSRLSQLMKKPLLRSTRVLEGLFHEHVVVVEGDADRAFYQEINERLLIDKPEWAIPNCLFLNAQGKDTIPTILKPLRDLGIPTASIVDVDILKKGGDAWQNQLKGVSIPEHDREAEGGLRSRLHKALSRKEERVSRKREFYSPLRGRQEDSE